MTQVLLYETDGMVQTRCFHIFLFFPTISSGHFIFNARLTVVTNVPAANDFANQQQGITESFALEKKYHLTKGL